MSTNPIPMPWLCNETVPSGSEEKADVLHLILNYKLLKRPFIEFCFHDSTNMNITDVAKASDWVYKQIIKKIGDEKFTLTYTDNEKDVITIGSAEPLDLFFLLTYMKDNNIDRLELESSLRPINLNYEIRNWFRDCSIATPEIPTLSLVRSTSHTVPGKGIDTETQTEKKQLRDAATEVLASAQLQKAIPLPFPGKSETVWRAVPVEKKQEVTNRSPCDIIRRQHRPTSTAVIERMKKPFPGKKKNPRKLELQLKEPATVSNGIVKRSKLDISVQEQLKPGLYRVPNDVSMNFGHPVNEPRIGIVRECRTKPLGVLDNGMEILSKSFRIVNISNSDIEVVKLRLFRKSDNAKEITTFSGNHAIAKGQQLKIRIGCAVPAVRNEAAYASYVLQLPSGQFISPYLHLIAPPRPGLPAKEKVLDSTEVDRFTEGLVEEPEENTIVKDVSTRNLGKRTTEWVEQQRNLFELGLSASPRALSPAPSTPAIEYQKRAYTSVPIALPMKAEIQKKKGDFCASAETTFFMKANNNCEVSDKVASSQLQFAQLEMKELINSYELAQSSKMESSTHTAVGMEKVSTTMTTSAKPVITSTQTATNVMESSVHTAIASNEEPSIMEASVHTAIGSNEEPLYRIMDMESSVHTALGCNEVPNLMDSSVHTAYGDDVPIPLPYYASTFVTNDESADADKEAIESIMKFVSSSVAMQETEKQIAIGIAEEFSKLEIQPKQFAMQSQVETAVEMQDQYSKAIGSGIQEATVMMHSPFELAISPGSPIYSETNRKCKCKCTCEEKQAETEVTVPVKNVTRAQIIVEEVADDVEEGEAEPVMVTSADCSRTRAVDTANGAAREISPLNFPETADLPTNFEIEAFITSEEWSSGDDETSSNSDFEVIEADEF